MWSGVDGLEGSSEVQEDEDAEEEVVAHLE